ncbi:fimbrillin family protein, partial [Bacteroides thetaiotaomicron]|uniref:fimbrillin family protein n=1 Tax=Bacteroides thetaiotaomicron TaxID=818 RepID=UPI001C8C17C6
MRKIFLALAVTALAASGCQREDFGSNQHSGPEVRFAAAMEPIDLPAGSLGATRGTPVFDQSDILEMRVFAFEAANEATAVPDFMDNQLVSRSSSTAPWTYSPKKYITDGATVNFYAYTPSATNNYSVGNPTGNGIVCAGHSVGLPPLRYTVPERCENQPDLMVAVPVIGITSDDGSVLFQMKHTLTCVGFQVSGSGQRIKSIGISGVSVAGTLNGMNGSAIVWNNLDPATTTDFTASLNYDAGENYYTATPTMSTTLLTGSGYLMMIPQTLGTDAKLTVTFTDNSTEEFSLSGFPNWTAGGKITYNISLTPPAVISVSPQGVIIPQTGTVSPSTYSFD